MSYRADAGSSTDSDVRRIRDPEKRKRAKDHYKKMGKKAFKRVVYDWYL